MGKGRIYHPRVISLALVATSSSALLEHIPPEAFPGYLHYSNMHKDPL